MIKRLSDKWFLFGKADPFFAALTIKGKKNNNWDAKEFFASGKNEIASIMAKLASLNLLIKKNHALDFGCGPGRLTLALADYFDNVVGVDVSASMIEIASRYNDKPEKVSYILNQEDNLSIFSDNEFDFIISKITLQHMESSLSKAYIVELMRLLAPGGVLVFQLPSQLKSWERSNVSLAYYLGAIIYNYVLFPFIHIVRRRMLMDVHSIKTERVQEIISKNSGKLILREEDGAAGDIWCSYCYYVAKE